MRRAVLAIALTAALAGCGGSKHLDTTPATVTQGPFAYDAGAPLDARANVVEDVGGIEVSDVSFIAHGRRTAGYLITPRTDERRPAVVFLHGAGGDRKELLPFAARWTAEGGVSLTIDAAPVANSTGVQAELRAQRDAAAATVIRVRRAVDYLRSLDAVDGKRIGFVGYSSGARTGAIVAGVERRIDAFALMSAGATPLAEYVAAAPQPIRADVRRLLGAVDPLRWVRHARPGTIFFQDGARDEVVPREALDNLRASAPKPQRHRRYAAGHELNATAYADQRAWLKQRLGLK